MINWKNTMKDIMETEKAQKLTDFDNQYFWKVNNNLRRLQKELAAIQAATQAAAASYTGMVEYLKDRYDLADSQEILPDGTIQ